MELCPVSGAVSSQWGCGQSMGLCLVSGAMSSQWRRFYVQAMVLCPGNGAVSSQWGWFCVQAVLSMFEDLGFVARHRMRSSSLSRFVLMVRKGYRDPPYHNWAHAFSVLHFCFLLYRNTRALDCLE